MTRKPTRPRVSTSRLATAVAALCFAASILGLAGASNLACGGTTGREGLPVPDSSQADAGQDATVPVDASGQDVDLDAGAFEVTILYADRILPDVQIAAEGGDGGDAGPPPPNCGAGTGVEARGNTANGACPPGQTNTGTLQDDAGRYCCSPTTLVPCTDAGQTGCVGCSGNTADTVDGGVPLCTPTEAQFVALDIERGLITDAGRAPSYVAPARIDGGIQSCYACLQGKQCLDDNLGDMGSECEDAIDDAGATTFTKGTTEKQCQATLACILGTSCNSSALSACYCGAALPSGSCATDTASANDPVPASTDPTVIGGSCDVEISAGLAEPVADGIDVLKNFTNTFLGAGRANFIFACGVAGKCTGCQ